MFDLVIRGGTVVDGSGAPGRRADVGVSGETIEAVGDLGRAEAGRVVEAAGLVVAPGFYAPARRFGLARRGRIERGWFADVVVFDADRVIDTATYDDPRRYPIGIPCVVVNGQLAVHQERLTGVLAGQAVP